MAQNQDALGRVNMAQAAGNRAREHFQAALQASINLGRPPVLLASMISIAELLAEEGDREYATLLASLVTNHPASQASVKERAAHLLTQLEADLSPEELAQARQKSQQRDLNAVAEQLIVDLATPRPSGDERPGKRNLSFHYR